MYGTSHIAQRNLSERAGILATGKQLYTYTSTTSPHNSARMGGQLSILAQSSPSIGIFSYIDVLEDVHYTSLLNSSRFLKTCKAVDNNGEIIIKVFIKPTDDYSLKVPLEELKGESLLLSQLPNVLNYSKIVESNRAGYLIRQHLRRNLYDRLSSRPYLHEIECKFIAFQLLQTLKDIHALNIVHSDIKTENVMVNSWNWSALTDFASHIKPIYLPEDNPGEFSFYFDTSKRRTCYIAPERFNTALYNDSSKRFTPDASMDIFSSGCCIAELFSEGIPIFNLAQLYKYKSGEYNVQDYLREHFPDNKELKDLIIDMIQLDPAERLSAVELLEKYRGIFFPDYFYNFTYDYFRTLATLMTSIPSTGCLNEFCTLEDKKNIYDTSLEKVYADFKNICTSLDFPVLRELPQAKDNKKHKTIFNNNYIKIGDDNIILVKSYGRYNENICVANECALLFISYLSRSLRNLTSNSHKVKCLELMTAFSMFISDDNKIDRVVPYLESCFEEDDNPVLQALSIQCLCQVLTAVEDINQLNENIFVDYLLPRLRKLLFKSVDHPYVRMVLANLIGNFANLISKFRELSSTAYFNSKKSENDEAIINTNRYATKLLQQMELIITSLLTDPNVWVKVSLLDNVLSLCKFLGKEKTNDIILSHLITYLNDRNPALRMALVETMSGIAILLGPITMEQYILPLLIQTLTDSEELVVTATIETLRDLCKTGLISEENTFGVAREVSPLLLHPNNSVRNFSLVTLYEISQKLSKPDLYCNLYPIIQPYFGFEVEFSLDVMLDSCKQSVSRTAYNMLCSWSLRASNSLFWKQDPVKETDSFGKVSVKFITKDLIPKNYGFAKNTSSNENANISVKSFDDSEVPLTTEDKLWIDKFKTLGMKDTDLWKLLILRGYILRTTKIAKDKNIDDTVTSDQNLDKRYASINLANVMPHNVFFDTKFIKQDEGSSEDTDRSATPVQEQWKENSVTSTVKSPSVMNMHGSLVLTSKPVALTTSNLRNVYVQLEPNKSHSKFHTKNTSTIEGTREIPIPEYLVTNSYEGNVDSIKDYLTNMNICPSINEYREFGIISNTIKSAPLSLTNLKGNVIRTLAKNIRTMIISVSASADSKSPYIISGTLEGVISIFTADSILDSHAYEPKSTITLDSTLTSLVMLKLFDTFVATTSDGFIRLFRIYQNDDVYDREQGLVVKIIRKLNINGTSKENLPEGEKEEQAIQIQECISDDNALLFFLTNHSRILCLDIRKMDNIQHIEFPVSHGGITALCVSKDNCVLIVGTSKGIIDVWDIRLKTLVNSWTFDDHRMIKEITLMPSIGKNIIVVVGGSSEGIISLWNYAKMQCRIVIALPGKKPSFEKFGAHTKHLDQLKYTPSKPEDVIQALHVRQNVICFPDILTSDLIMINLANIQSSKVATEAQNHTYKFGIEKGTVNLSLISVERSTSAKTQTTTKSSQTSPTTLINTIETIETQGKLLLIASDTMGIISIYE